MSWVILIEVFGITERCIVLEYYGSNGVYELVAMQATKMYVVVSQTLEHE
jgi:hypothetical protein